MKKRTILQVIIGISIVVLILNKLNISELIAALKNISYSYFILACLSYLSLNFVLSSRLRYLLAKIGHQIRFPTVFFSHMGGMLVGDVTPGRGGYFLTPPILKKNTGTRVTDGMACIFAPQGVEFILKVGGAFAAIVFISTLPGINTDLLTSAGVGAVLLLLIGILMLIVSWKNENMSFKFIHIIPFFNKFTEKLQFFKERSVQIKESINAILMFTLIGWVFAALHWYFIGKALGFQLSYFVFFLLHPLLSILMFVPLSPAGFGLLEGGAIIVFSLFGISAEPAMAFIVLVRVSILLVDLIGLNTLLYSLRDLEL